MGASKKIVLLGQFGVGKTSLLRRYLTDTFSQDYVTTLGVVIKKKEVALPSGKTLSMIIWDLEGFSNIERTRSSYLMGSQGFIHVFDLSRPVTYYNLHEELEYIKNKYPEVVVEVVGNKSDLKDPAIVQEYLKTKNITVNTFVSAKSGEGVEALFTRMAIAVSN